MLTSDYFLNHVEANSKRASEISKVNYYDQLRIEREELKDKLVDISDRLFVASTKYLAEAVGKDLSYVNRLLNQLESEGRMESRKEVKTINGKAHTYKIWEASIGGSIH